MHDPTLRHATRGSDLRTRHGDLLFGQGNDVPTRRRSFDRDLRSTSGRRWDLNKMALTISDNVVVDGGRCWQRCTGDQSKQANSRLRSSSCWWSSPSSGCCWRCSYPLCVRPGSRLRPSCVCRRRSRSASWWRLTFTTTRRVSSPRLRI